jgi:hypothetical protein
MVVRKSNDRSIKTDTNVENDWFLSNMETITDFAQRLDDSSGR